MKKNVVLVCVAIVAVAAIGYFAINGFPPTGWGTQGTVGAATRHQSEQITKSDVVLGDTKSQAILQTEFFDRVSKDPQLQNLLADKNFSKLMADQNSSK
jgi:hypothetical protein